MITAADVAAQALRYVGTPFAHQGRVLGVGVDCAGLVACVARDLGIDGGDVTGYGRLPDPARFMVELGARLLPTTAPAVGVIMHFAFGRQPMHLGIHLGGDRFTHAYQGHGVIVSTLATAWARRLRGCWRYRGVTYG